jgi:asparagine synthase (glutamine-hydrolysing)
MRAFCGRVGSGSGPVFRGGSEPPVVGRCSIAHRGFIANRASLGSAARRPGDAVETLTDAALFAFAHDRWGAGLPQHVLGEYAVAVFEGERRRLVLAHDELGLMPLFYSLHGDAITFSSHLDDIVFATGTGDIDEEYVADYFACGEHFGERTPYAHIRRLLPGESLVWENGRLSRHDTWTLANVARLAYGDEREYDAHLRHLISEAVAAHTPASGKVWSELSGGLDSSTVLAVASGLRTDVEAVSFVFPESYTADERQWIEIALRRYPVPWHPIDGDSAQPFTEFPRRFIAEPNAWVANAAYDRAYVDLLTQHEVSVVLTGEGGDSVLFGDAQLPFFLADSLLRGRIRALWHDAARWAAASEGRRSLTYTIATNALRPALRHLRREALEYRRMRIPWAEERFAKRTSLDRRSRRSWLPPAASVGDAYVLQRVMRSANLIATHTHHRHIACEFRNPLLYRPLVEFMLAIPWERKLAPGGDRLLHRRAFDGILPAETLRRTDKGGSDQPSYDGLERGAAWVRALTERPRLVEHGYARLDEWRSAVHSARVGRSIGIGYFRASAALEMWFQQLEQPLGNVGRAVAQDTRAVL